MDIHSGKRKRLTTGTKYFSPDFLTMAKRLLQQKRILPVNRNLTILDASNGNVIQSLPNPDQLFFTYPVFNKNDDKIFSAVRNPAGQMALMAFNIATGGHQYLVHLRYKSLHLTVYAEILLYSRQRITEKTRFGHGMMPPVN